MKRILKITAILLVLSTLFCCFGCKDKKPDDITSQTGADTTEDTAEQSGSLVVVDNGKSNYVVVWRGRAKDAEKSAAFDLCEWIKTSTGAELEKKTDTAIATADDFKKMRKIVVGRLDRHATKKWSELGENDYCIEAQDGDIYIYGGSSQAIYSAALKFKEQFLSQEQANLSMASNFVLKYNGANERADYINDPFSIIPTWIDEFQASAPMLDFDEKKESLAKADGRLMSLIHRGDAEHYPENSIEGIISSIQMGADIIEIDVRLTKDKVAVLMHDDTLTRTTNYSFVKGSTVNGVTLPTTDDITQWTYEQLMCLKLYEGNGGGKLTDYIIPTLEEVLKVAKGNCFILCDKITSYNDFKNIVLPVIIKVGAYDTVIMNPEVTDSGALAIRNTISALPNNSSKSVPFFMDKVSGSTPNKWQSAISTNANEDLIPFFNFSGGLQPSGSSVLEQLAYNETNLKTIKGKSRLLISCYGNNGIYETPDTWNKCEELGLNVIFAEKTIAIQKYIYEKYFS